MLHLVGHLPAAVYWRRRALVLGLLLAVVGGGGWVVVDALTARHGLATAAATAPATARWATGAVAVQGDAAGPSAAPVPCADEALTVEVQASVATTPAAKPSFALRITNGSPVACARPLDATRQEIVLLDGAGHRLWSSNDCIARTAGTSRTLAPGEAVSFPVTWSGLTSEPTCTAPGTPLPPGPYVVRGRLDTKTTPDRAVVLG